MSFDFAIRLLGTEVFAFTFGRPSDAEPDPPAMEAGAGHNFERDSYPPNPSGEEPCDRFGFGAR